MTELIQLLLKNPLTLALITIFYYAYKFYPIWLPFFLFVAFWRSWMSYVQSKFIASQEYIVLEFKLPREILKTPLAMEQVFSNLYYTAGETTFIDRVWKGKCRAWFSFEIVSIEGKVHFFVWVRESLRNYLEAQIYANYPSVEVHEVPDYAKELFFSPGKNSLWGCDMALSKPDPYPIKTYVDYGLDKDQTEEESKVDPMTPLIEFMATMKKGEIMAVQIMTRAHKNPRFPAGMIEKGDHWKNEAKKEVERIRKEATPEHKGSAYPAFPNPTKGQVETIGALERSISKYGFDAGVRILYYADNDSFSGVNIPSMLSMFRQFGSNNLNSFQPKRWSSNFDYPWQDIKEIRQNRMRHRLIKAWKRRSYFYAPYKFKPSILNTEELATLFHFPGKVLETPTFSRVPSKKSGAPSNIPV